MTTTEAGFIDATPIKPSKLVDFWHSTHDCPKALKLAEEFWQKNKSNPNCAKLWSAAVHALFISHWPKSLQFEQFTYLYVSLDACFALAKKLNPTPLRLSHSERVEWMCQLFHMSVPVWADKTPKGSAEIAAIRNATIHEGLFMDAPLGFALHGIGTNQNLTLEMQALVGRLLVALIGLPITEYVRSPTGSRQMHRIDFGTV